MNTVKIGDKFENKSYDLLEKAINNDELGISKSSAKVFRKKGYYSKDREKYIIFDLSIEIWPKNANIYTLLYLIECKSSNSKKVPVDDVEEFYAKINQVAGVNLKGVMISDNSFQSGGLTFAKNKGMMLIEVDRNNNYSIILYRSEKKKGKKEKEKTDDILFKTIKKTLGFGKVKGVKILSSEQIENLTIPILKKYNNLTSAINIDNFIDHLKNEYNIKFDFTKNLETINGKTITGYFDLNQNKIFIDQSIIETNKFPFILGHELGHFFLHSNLKLNQEKYNDFEDSKYNFFTDKHDFKNDKNWIEWQANKFAISLFLPKSLFLSSFLNYRKMSGIRSPNHIHLDDQPVNIKDYNNTVNHLYNFFGISKISIKYRLEKLNLVTYDQKKDDIRSITRRILFK